jgi:hypothetical protein
MTSDEADSRNVAIRKQALADIKMNVLEMLEMDPDQIMWDNVASLANSAADIVASTEVEEE